jgi:sulfate/thiosulfate transport system substrate-binding protein
LILVVMAVALVGFRNISWDRDQQLLNVSYDPTRELYREINASFTKKYAKDTGTQVHVEQSHGGSSQQARAVADGVPADVVTLALPSDIDGLAKRRFIASDWRTRYPHAAQPYSSTIVFVVRKGNPKQIKDWPDLIRPGWQVVTPDPKTSGNGMLSLLAGVGASAGGH